MINTSKPAPGRDAAIAAALYLLIAIGFTWPLARGLTRDIPWDLGDSLLNAWTLAWNAARLTRLFAGDFGVFNGWWNANIFHPEPLALAYSEHLFAQSVQVFPVYALTGNLILSYNLLFLSTFVLSGLGTYLLVRELTGSRPAAFTAGLIYAFAPYRVPQFSHLQVLSSQWMPFALFGFRRYFEGRRSSALAGAGAALIAQNLSNGYFLLFFSPVAAAYVLFEIVTRGLWRDRQVWTAVSVTAVVVVAATAPFGFPYLKLRWAGELPPRPIEEVATYSADVFSYWTAPAESHTWGDRLRAFPKREGDLFPTLTALLLTATALIFSARTAWAKSAGSQTGRPQWLVVLLLGICGMSATLLMLLFGGHAFSGGGVVPVTVRGVGRPALVFALAMATLLVISARWRSFANAWLRHGAAFAALAAGVAALLSLGPEIRAQGRTIGDLGPYALFYWFVPGFDGLRVPARFAMIVMLFLATLSGIGAAAIARRSRLGGTLVIALGLLAVVESLAAPIVVNGTAAEGGYAEPPPRVHTGEAVPSVYRFLRQLPPDRTVIVEFPFGEWGYELRYMFYSTNHWHPLLNGYSGAFPLSYGLRASVLRHPLRAPDRAWGSLVADGATHAVVHERLYVTSEGQDISGWLLGYGATLVAEFDGDKVFALR